MLFDFPYAVVTIVTGGWVPLCSWHDNRRIYAAYVQSYRSQDGCRGSGLCEGCWLQTGWMLILIHGRPLRSASKGRPAV